MAWLLKQLPAMIYLTRLDLIFDHLEPDHG